MSPAAIAERLVAEVHADRTVRAITPVFRLDAEGVAHIHNGIHEGLALCATNRAKGALVTRASAICSTCQTHAIHALTQGDER